MTVFPFHPSRQTITYVDPDDTEWVDFYGHPSNVGLGFSTKTVHARSCTVSAVTGQRPMPVEHLVTMIVRATRELADLVTTQGLVISALNLPAARTIDGAIHVQVDAWPVIPGITVPRPDTTW